ncbi:MAG: exodeoxyribonuclease VII large subunit, partial [Clostridia bacterium]|nr:exodeoxyribonuclease VII large subunit [Clostridia bacterium]
SAASALNFEAKNGMRVTVHGRVSVYEKSGRYQIYVSTMAADGIGALYLEYRRLFEQLSREGLFDEARKRPLPVYPKCIGIITSPTGAAVRDMINVTGRRYPAAKILLYPSLVQGREAPASLCTALDYLNAESECDVIIIGRGGGSIEDLWAFNDEQLARRVAASRIPVISAVGHETDFTLCDFAADKRAPTPSAAAELAVPDRYELLGRLDEMAGKLDGLLGRGMERRQHLLADRQKRLQIASPEAKVSMAQDRTRVYHARMEKSMKTLLERSRLQLGSRVSKLSAMNPLSVLERGYGVVERDGRILSSVKDMAVGDMVTLRVSDGKAQAEIRSIEMKNNEN